MNEREELSAIALEDALESVGSAEELSELLAAEREAGRREQREIDAEIAEKTVCATHLPTGVRIYGTKAADAIRAHGATTEGGVK